MKFDRNFNVHKVDLFTKTICQEQRNNTFL